MISYNIWPSMKKLHPIVVIFFTFWKKVRVWKTIFLSTVNDFLYIVRNTSIKMINPEQADRKKKKKKVYLLRKIAGEFKLCGDEV